MTLKALILAGGRGTRLRPLTHTHAKQLIPVANKPILYYGLETIAGAGIKDVGMIVGDTRHEIQKAVGDGGHWGLSVTYIHQKEPLGLANAVQVARGYLKSSPFVLYLGDNILLENLRPFIETFVVRKPAALILLNKVKDPQRFGVASIDAQNRVVRLEEKPQTPQSDLALVGVYMFNPDIFTAIATLKPSRRGEYEITDAIQSLIERGHVVLPFTVNSWWKDTGKKADLLEANTILLDRIQACIEGEVVASCIQGRVRIEAGAKVVGSIIRGPVIIGAGAQICNAYVGPYTSVGAAVEITDTEIGGSIVMRGSRLVRVQPRLEDSLIGEGVSILPQSEPPRALKLMLGDHSQVELA